MSKKILLLGATGRTGKYILDECTKKEYTVHVLVRYPEKLETSNKLINVIKGNPDKVNLKKALKGCHIVISALNISRKSDFPWSDLRTPKHLLSTTMQNIVDELPVTPLERIIVLSAWGVHETYSELPFWFRWFIKNSNIGPAYRDHEKQENVLKASNVNWTAVRPVGLTSFGKIQSVKVSINGQPKPHLTINRKSVARFVVDLIENGDHINSAPVISSK